MSSESTAPAPAVKGLAPRPITTVRTRRHDVLYVPLAYVAFLGLPFLAYVWIGGESPEITRVVHYAAATAYALTAVIMLLEALVALPRREAPIAPDAVLPRVPLVSVIVAAYLPNEQDFIR